MADYQRILSYLYRYEKAEKKECPGFVKAEQRTGNLKLTIQIDDERLLQGMELKLCFYEKQGENWQVWHLDTVITQEHKEELYLTYPAAQLPEGFRIKGQSGVLLYYQDSFYYGSVWIGEEIPSEVLEPLRWHKVKDSENAQENIAETAEEITKEDKEESAEEVVSESLLEENQKEESLQKIIEKVPQLRENIKEGSIDSESMIEDNIEIKEVLGNVADKASETHKAISPIVDNFEEMWINSVREKPSVDNIFNTAFYEGCRIEPADLEGLGKEAGILRSNQFLLKGYERYKHLLAGKVRYAGEERYCIGVPGIYENREKYMADIYQFPVFLSLTENRIKTGSFGYWLYLLCN